MRNLRLEMRYAIRERAVVSTLVFSLLITSWAVGSGVMRIDEQRVASAALVAATQQDQQHVLGHQADAGSAAYYVFHFTYQPPEPLSYAALGTLNELPWQHRLRMLALEGQIYESDTTNPELAQLGQLDFTFVVSILVPLLLILLLYDLSARERREGRYELLIATSASDRGVLIVRALARAMWLFVSVIVPFVVASAIVGVSVSSMLAALTIVVIHFCFWGCMAFWLSSKCDAAPTSATVLLAAWFMFTLVVPALGRVAVEEMVPVPAGGEILLNQREAVNDGWDLPKPHTMQRFVRSHPEWQDTPAVEQPFEWRWYYAFHQLGDEFVQEDSRALTAGIAQRDDWMGMVSWMSPPLATQRWLTNLAGTDRKHHQRYIQCVREFHASLRAFHYPMLFGSVNYSQEYMQQLPQFRPCRAD